MSLKNYVLKRQPNLIRGKPPKIQAQQDAWFAEVNVSVNGVGIRSDFDQIAAIGR
jgi:hypothetical protein